MTVDNFINFAPIIYAEGAFYVVGGYTYRCSTCSSELKTIGRLGADGEWTRAGELNTGRHAHKVIYDGEFLIVVGGVATFDTFKTEKCSIESGLISCVSQNPDLDNYAFYPELFLVPDSFCEI